MINKEEVLIIHDEVLKLYGGATGVRDMGGLESAIARPFQTFSETDLYPTCFEKSSCNWSMEIKEPDMF